MMNIREGKFVNLNRLESYDIALSLPTETGLPFVHTFNIPVLFRMAGTVQAELKAGNSVAAKNSLRLVHAKKIQGRIGFVTPFDHQQLIAGIDLNFQMFAPLKWSMNLNTPKRSFEMKLWPMKGEEKARLLHYSVVPFTAIHDILSLRPLLTEKTTQRVRPENLKTVTIPDSDSGSKIKINMEAIATDELLDLKNLDMDKWINMLMNPWSMDNDNYRNVNVFVNAKRDLVEPVVLTVSTERVELSPDDNNDNAAWTSKALAMEPSDKESRSEARKKQMLTEAARGIRSAMSTVIDAHLHVPDELKTTLTIATANSNVEKKGRTLLYMRNSMDRSGRTPTTVELCAAAQAKATPNGTPFSDQATQTRSKLDLDVDVRVGSSCSEGEQITVNGKATQTKNLSEQIKKSALMKECQRQMEQGNRMLRACQNVATLSMILDELNLTVNMQSRNVATLITEMFSRMRNTKLLSIQSDLKTLENADRSKIDIRAKLSDDLKKIDLSVRSPVMDLELNDIGVLALGISTDDALMAAENAMDIRNSWFNRDEREYSTKLNCLFLWNESLSKYSQKFVRENPRSSCKQRISCRLCFYSFLRAGQNEDPDIRRKGISYETRQLLARRHDHLPTIEPSEFRGEDAHPQGQQREHPRP